MTSLSILCKNEAGIEPAMVQRGEVGVMQPSVVVGVTPASPVFEPSVGIRWKE
jgi:hypothetical protein